jgi:hypothetical protein
MKNVLKERDVICGFCKGIIKVTNVQSVKRFCNDRCRENSYRPDSKIAKKNLAEIMALRNKV